MQNFDVVMPDGNEKDFIEMALRLGYKELVFLSRNINYNYTHECTGYVMGISVKTAYLLKDQSEIHKARKNFNYVFANADRRFFEMDIDYIINSELSERQDSFHYRSTRLNQVHAKLASENDTNIVMNFSLLLNPATRCMMLGRMMQNAELIKKYRLRNAVFSLANTPMGMRSRAMLDALGSILCLKNA